MGKIDLWSFFIGIISIASFMLAMWDRFPALKKDLLPVGYVLLGVVIGRVSFISMYLVSELSNSLYCKKL